MTLQSSGLIKLSQVNTELGLSLTNPVKLSDLKVRTLAGMLTGSIKFSHLYGKSNGAIGKGYWIGGYTGDVISGIENGEIDGIDYNSETSINPAATLANGYGVSLCPLKSSIKGYLSGGYANDTSQLYPNLSYTLAFSTETVAGLTALLSIRRVGMVGLNSSTKGYYTGGEPSSIPYCTNKVDGVMFSTDTSFSPSAVLAVARAEASGFSSITRGYSCGGMFPMTPGYTLYSSIETLVFNTETISLSTSSLPSALGAVSSVNSSSKGFLVGSPMFGFDFTTETAYTTSMTLFFSDNTSSYGYGGCNSGNNSSLNGYVGSGWNLATYTSNSVNISGIKFSNETSYAPAAKLVSGRAGAVGIQSYSIMP